jgi:ribosomal protein S18 acetylase RimI-like enzyme
MEKQCTVIIADFAKKKHRDAFTSLIDEYRRGATGDGVGLERHAAARLISGVKNHPAARVYFAVCEGRIVGCATCFVGFSTFQSKRLMNIHDLIVTRDFRRQGIARNILEQIESDAKIRDYCKITLEVRSDNDDALHLYSNAGFGPGKHLMYFLTKSIR